MRPPDRIETARLVLRPPDLGDAPALFETYMQDTEVTRYVMWRPHTDIEQTVTFLRICLQHWENGQRFPYVITLKGTGTPIGMVDIHFNGSTAGLGYVIGRPFWGRGYMPEAVRSVVDWALGQPDIFRVAATCDVENIASARVMEKVGMQREGVLRRLTIHPNISPKPRDCYIYAIVK